MNNKIAFFLLFTFLLSPSCGVSNTQMEQAKEIATEILEEFTDASPEQPAEKTSKKKYSTYAIAFYNLENLFDTIDDPTINDEDFLPDGQYQWNTEKYTNKIKNMSTVLADIASDQNPKQGAAVIGVAEVENRAVCMDLVNSEALRKRGYRVLHFDSPDKRGIDCALLYNPKVFHLKDSLYVQYVNPKQKSVRTRGFLVGIGTMAGEKLAIIVNHWPSRGSESYTRERAGSQVKSLIEQLQNDYPGIKVITMGDLNDDPDNKSLAECMQCKYSPADVKQSGDIFNPWLYMLRTVGQGTLLFKGEWNLFDQILVTGNMVDRNMQMSSEKPTKESINTQGGLTFYYNEVINRDYMAIERGASKGGPKRTLSGDRWYQDGYSDHFPTCIYLLK